ncbi:hypothetical protein [Clostridium tarantellae]|uniref:Uncharacterized protein n=1 Tax=Clostridium tarantellae TaxID=39493 RepID=A0A6I1MRH4_9CLOT|nr:hypothetical protein [Clostridium tarantellae]MPQ42889.1 hypothetical protein [Clostridium tarantellae]
MGNQEELLNMAENCDEYLSLNKGIISSVSPYRSCHTCYNSKNGVCDKEIGIKAVYIQDKF